MANKPRVPLYANPFQIHKINGATFTFGAEAANMRPVTVQLKDQTGGRNLTSKGIVRVWLSDAADPTGITGTAADGGIAAGAQGAILTTQVTGKMVSVLSNATGGFILNITHSAAKTWFVVVELPNGEYVVSAALAFV